MDAKKCLGNYDTQSHFSTKITEICLFQFSQESAFPKMNKDESNRQFMTCSGDMYILIWDLLKPEQEAEGGAQQVQAMQDEVPSSLTINYS